MIFLVVSNSVNKTYILKIHNYLMNENDLK